MMNFKKVTTMLIAMTTLVSTVSLMGCSKATTKDATTTTPPKYAMVLKTLSNPFWVTMKEGIEAEAKAKGVTVDILSVTSESDTQGQLQLFENLLSKGYQGIGFAPLSPVNLVSAAAEAYKKGIYLVNIDEKVDMTQLKSAGGNVIAFVTTDNVKIGEKAAKHIIGKLGASGGEVAIIEGMAGNASGKARKDGASDAFKASASIKVVASQPADWDRTKALDVATNLIQRYPNLKAIYCANDTMALGAMQAVTNAKKTSQIIVVGTDGAPEAIKEVKAGNMEATIGQDSAKVGATSLDLLIDATNSKKNITATEDPKLVSVDSILITK